MEHGFSAAVCIYEPRDPKDVALIEAAFSGTEIVYHIDNRRYALACGGPAVGDAQRKLLVRRDQATEARELLSHVVRP